jgi:hypothetical protein
MIKMIGLLKRKPGMSTEAFRDYYESKHRLIGEKYLKDHACRYSRRYLTPLLRSAAGREADTEYDVVLEVWYPDQAAYDASIARLGLPEVAAEIAEDEERFLDRPKNRFFTIEERESEI